MDYLDFVMVEQATKDITGRKTECTQEEVENTKISLVFVVGMSSPLAGHHWSITQFGRE
jgi:hypothetical protein